MLPLSMGMVGRKDMPMANNSNPNHRPLSVITYLAANPTETFTLAEIARDLGLSKGSAHRVMAALTEAGFVYRHPRNKAYSLGLALVAIGSATLERYAGIEIAKREMARLARDFGLGCAATAILNNEYILLAREGTPASVDGLALVGERRFVVPGIGIGQMAWRGQSDIDAYAASGGAYMTDSLRDRLLASLPIIRRRGYAMAANGTGMRRLSYETLVPIGQVPDKPPTPALEWIDDIPLEEFQMLEFAEAKGRGVNYLAAPVFSAEGEIVFEILISRLPVEMSQTEFEFYETQLLNAADTITRQIRGCRPQPW